MQPWFTVYFFNLILDIHVIINWHLSKQSIHWSVSRDHIANTSLKLIEVTCFLKLTAGQMLVFDWIAGSCQVLLKQDQIVLKPVNANPGLKVNRIISFLLYKCFLLLCFVYMVIVKTQNRRPNNIQKTSPQSYKTQIKILPFPGLA